MRNNISIQIYSGNASSPNSNASSAKIMEDVAAVAHDPVMLEDIMLIAEKFPGGDNLIQLLKNLIADVKMNYKRYFNEKKEILVRHSRLFHFTAPGGKSRVIANVDWITQSVLSGIHYLSFDLLKTMISDFTFDHKSGINHVLLDSNDEKKCFYSIDLSAATDRMPVKLQTRIIHNILEYFDYDGNDIAFY